LGNLIGTNKEGDTLLPPAPNTTTGFPVGVDIENASQNTVGGTASGAGNIISGFGVAVVVAGFDASNNLIQGNLIGTAPGGSVPSNSVGVGVYINGAPQNTVDGNVIQSYSSYGVSIYGAPATENVVQANRIGAPPKIGRRAAGKGKRPGHAGATQLAGIAIQGASSNTIGGSTMAGNTITGNQQAGVYIFGNGNATSGNAIMGNRISNNLYGILLYNAPNNSGGSITLRNINRFAKNNIANVREFTGAVPAANSSAGGASTNVRKRRHRAVRPGLGFATPTLLIPLRIERHEPPEMTTPNHP
jgi:hypothetical protein